MNRFAASWQVRERIGGHTLLLPMVIAFIVYILLHLAINGLLRMIAHRKTDLAGRVSRFWFANSRRPIAAIDRQSRSL